MASRILGMGDVVSFVEKAQKIVDEKEAEVASIHKQCEEQKQSIECLEKKLVDNTR